MSDSMIVEVERVIAHQREQVAHVLAAMFGVLGLRLAIDLLVKSLIHGYRITTVILIEHGVGHLCLRVALLAALRIARIEEHVHL